MMSPTIDEINPQTLKLIYHADETVVYFVVCKEELLEDGEGALFSHMMATREFVKIGKTSVQSLLKRVDQLQTGNPHQLTLIAWMRGNLEKQLHNRFIADKVRGDWFEYTEEIQDFVSTHAITAEHGPMIGYMG